MDERNSARIGNSAWRVAVRRLSIPGFKTDLDLVTLSADSGGGICVDANEVAERRKRVAPLAKREMNIHSKVQQGPREQFRSYEGMAMEPWNDGARSWAI
ncbi:unnamed protein product [Ostreobium quekettii]|uniref:Uncharacterized protein n=1 Tax=Ostreobium quekettii TaxID=121088 RepID=A0A8S1IYT6_9CHLO|nr:unnamed protein product [Ostreobium quekettii]